MADAKRTIERRMTVSATYQTRANGRGRTVPMLRLRGDWLRQLGFARGTRIVVALESKRLVVTAE